jgi:hypothetical protein
MNKSASFVPGVSIVFLGLRLLLAVVTDLLGSIPEYLGEVHFESLLQNVLFNVFMFDVVLSLEKLKTS